ncbi:hypothetical protein JYB64_13510 [Algoriphagus aestuarii]|nr:hypothetical protein [Algoriphagus aestuarii]
MKRNLLEKLCCPFDKSNLKIQVIQETDSEEIIEGLLTCDSCERYFPIIYGIPIMTPDEYREKSLELPNLERWGLEMDTKTNSFKLAGAKTAKELE